MNECDSGSQVPRRSPRQKVRENRTRKWAESSVWRLVCAMELGLVDPQTFSNAPEKSGRREEKTGGRRIKKKKKISSHSKNNVSYDQLDRRIQSETDSENCCSGRYFYRGRCYSKKPTNFRELNAFQDSSRNDRLSRNHAVDYETTSRYTDRCIRSLSCTDTSSENDDFVPQELMINHKKHTKNITDVNTERCFEDSDENEEMEAMEIDPPKRQYFPRKHDDPLWSNANKEKQNTVERSRELKKVDQKITTVEAKSSRTKVHERTVEKEGTSNAEKEIERIPLDEDVVVEVVDPTIDYVDSDSDIDEMLLDNSFTDLPSALVDTIIADNDIVDFKSEIDVIKDLNLSTNMSFSGSELIMRTEDNVAEMERYDGIDDESEESDNQSNSRNYRKKGINVEKDRRVKSISCDDRRKKRRSADDDIVSNNNEDKENSLNNNNGARVTRGTTKNWALKENNLTSYTTGTVVWGNCMGWWPGLIVDAADVGMCEAVGKSWVYWIGESRISQLRNKTQVQPFSNSLRTRMIETLRFKGQKDLNYVTCVATIKLLKERILQQEGPLKKPYHAWVEKNIVGLDNLDQLILYPYPANVQQRLDELKKGNAKTTEKYLSELKRTADKPATVKNNVSSKTAVKQNVQKEPEHLPLMDQKPGVITWAKIMGQVWWPAMIIDFRDCGMKEPSFGCQWILWYGDDTLSQVNHWFFLDFAKGVARMKDYVQNCKRDAYRKGFLYAAKDYCARYGYNTDSWTIDDVFEWFSKFDNEEEAPCLVNDLPGITGNGEMSQKYPARIVEGLRKHKGNCTVAAVREHNIKDSDALESVLAGKLDLKDLCLMCLSDCKDIDVKMDHPFFEGELCNECAEKYKPTIFAYGDDGKCFFCTVCAGSDTVVMCDGPDCPRVFCTACLKYLVTPKAYDEIMLNDPWFCFICEDSPNLLAGGLLKPRKDWKDRVSKLFHTNKDSVPNQVQHYKSGKKKIRVLSLFDGLSAGLVVLKKLGIEVEVYYASEIDPDAEMVSSAHFGDQIIRLGDVKSITDEKIQEIAPIDLLIGGSPCNDLSLVNPVRRGLHDPNGTGILVFEYCRIKNLIEKMNKGQHFFWLFENVASMPSKYRLEINEHLGREPDLIDSANYSPQHRPRLYWGNLPSVSYPLSSQDLQDVLTPNCNRHALVKKIRTVTTRVNSLKQGKDLLKPILMNERTDCVWITELEEIFGFPRHYTDVKNLSATKRQKLIGMSWSVQTITEIMRPLCNFFKVRNTDSS